MVSDPSRCYHCLSMENERYRLTFLTSDPNFHNSEEKLQKMFKSNPFLQRDSIRHITTLVIILVGLMVFWQCQPTKQSDDQLVIISPHPDGIKEVFGSSFKAWYEEQTGKTVEVNWRDAGGTSTNYKLITTEFDRLPDGIEHDIFFGGGTDSYLRLAELDLLTPYKLPDEQLKLIPQSYHGIPVYDAQYRWYGAVLSSFGIMYNDQVREIKELPIPAKWEDLGNIALIDEIGAADPRESGSAHMMYEIILQTHGWEKGFALLTKLGGNVKKFSAGSNVIPRDVANGEVIYGLAIDFYAYSQIAAVGEDKIKYVLPTDGIVVNPDSIAILKGAPNMEVAKKFIAFVLSEKAQKLWMLPEDDPEGPNWEGGLNRASVIPTLYDELGERSIVTNPFKLPVDPFPYDAEVGSKRWDIVNDLFGVLIIDSHKDLVDAWTAISNTEDPEKRETAIAALVQMPITEQEALTMAETKWDNAVYRNEKIKEWGQFAEDKFKKVKNLTE